MPPWLALAAKRARTAPTESVRNDNELHMPEADDQPRSFVERILRLQRPAFTYDMDSRSDKLALVDKLWSGEYKTAIGRFVQANPHFVNLLEQQVVVETEDASIVPRRLRPLQGSMPRFDSVISSIFRWRSQKQVTLETAALSVRFLHYRVPRPVWESVSFFSRLVMSRTWTEDLCELALEHDPGPRYTTVERSAITAAVFDNFTIQVGYGSYATIDKKGTRFDMTNWASLYLAAIAAPGCTRQALSALVRGRGRMFREDMSLLDFTRLFYIDNPEIVANQNNRWAHYLLRASEGRFNERPSYTSPYPPSHFVWMPPMPGRLQSSYADVNFEIDYIRSRPEHAQSLILMLGGDGLSYMRIIHRIAQNPQFYLFHDEKPAIIPRLGEHPHGTYHLLHGDWRIWWPFIMKAAEVVQNKQVVADPNVTEFNQSEHFLRILTQACAEFVVEISRTGTTYRIPSTFLKDADANLSFAYVCQFLYLFGFKFKQMRDSVRINDSHTLDLIWRENLASAKAATKHGTEGEHGKTNYAAMSVVLIYWGRALREPLAHAYHATRTLRMVDAHVGWDYPIEYLNKLIKESVVANITFELINKFIRTLNFTYVVHRGMIVKANREPDAAKLKEIATEKDKIKEWLRKSIGSDYSTCTAPSEENKLNLDLTRWGGARNTRRGAPWAKRRAVMVDVQAYVRKKMEDYTPWHRWA